MNKRSDDVVEAAWNNGLGVHALIWVRALLVPLYRSHTDRRLVWL